jgi:hypothetical protein
MRKSCVVFFFLVFYLTTTTTTTTLKIVAKLQEVGNKTKTKRLLNWNI